MYGTNMLQTSQHHVLPRLCALVSLLSDLPITAEYDRFCKHHCSNSASPQTHMPEKSTPKLTFPVGPCHAVISVWTPVLEQNLELIKSRKPVTWQNNVYLGNHQIPWKSSAIFTRNPGAPTASLQGGGCGDVWQRIALANCSGTAPDGSSGGVSYIE